MGTQSKRLSARFVETAGPGMHADGDGLYLVVSPKGAKRWTFIFNWRDKGTSQNRAEMGLGKAGVVSLAEAREAAQDARRMVARGENPIEARKADRTSAASEKTTFGEFAQSHVDQLAHGFRNPKHVEQWRTTLREDAGGLSDLPLSQIDTEAVLRVLRPIWLTKPETASRLRGRIERVLDAARVAGKRSGENPARWRGHLGAILPKRPKLTRGHHAAMPYAEVPAFMAGLAGATGVGAAALQVLILTASRTGEVIGAKWDEFDLEAGLWIIPKERMKAGREHRVPLSAAAITILRRLQQNRSGPFVFPGAKPDTVISNMAMTKALKTAKAGEFTVHGFRSSFRDWAGEETNFPDALAEAALAHVVGDATERAYRRGDALAKRRKLMVAWERYCLTAPGNNVIPIKAAAK